MGTFLLAKKKRDQDCCKEKSDCHYDLEITSFPSPSSPDTAVPAESYRKTAAFRDFFTSKKISCFAIHFTFDIVIVLALSTHSVLEGLAVGLGLSNSDVWTLTIGRNSIGLLASCTPLTSTF